MMSPPPKDTPDSDRLPKAAVALVRSMDFSIPIWGVVCLLGALAYWLITMNTQQQQILSTMAELKAAVQTGNSQTMANAGQISIMQFRMEKVEADHARMLKEKDSYK